MEFTRTKKLTFFNNKGGVGKTTLAFNTAVEFAQKGYKTVLIDLDPQCNLSRLALGDEYFQNTLLSQNCKSIADVLQGVVNGGGDIDLNIHFEPTIQGTPNLSLLRGSIYLSNYENLLITSYNSAAAGNQRGYFDISAINRFLNHKALEEEIDIFIIDTSPSPSLLNQIILLGTDYFVVPMCPDAFSLQGIEHLGLNLEKWKKNWKDTGRVLSKSNNIESQFVLDGEGLFIGYILNSYNVYNQQPIKDHRRWIDEIPQVVKRYLSEKHSKNGLVASSSAASLQNIQDYGRIPATCQETGTAIFNLNPNNFPDHQEGSRQNIEKAKTEFNDLAENILEILHKY